MKGYLTTITLAVFTLSMSSCFLNKGKNIFHRMNFKRMRIADYLATEG